MRILIFGATGMVGQGALRAALADPRVVAVTIVGRSATGHPHLKVTEHALPDLFDLASLAAELSGFDACFFSLGVSSFRMPETTYRRITFDLTVSIASFLLPRNPSMAFLYVSGAGTDASGKGRSMWARIKGQTENALLRMPFRAAYMLRPGLIVPRDGIQSKTAIYRAIYAVLRPALLLLQPLFPNAILDTRQLGRAMLALAAANLESRLLGGDGIPKNRVLENRDLIRLAKRGT